MAAEGKSPSAATIRLPSTRAQAEGSSSQAAPSSSSALIVAFVHLHCYNVPREPLNNSYLRVLRSFALQFS